MKSLLHFLLFAAILCTVSCKKDEIDPIEPITPVDNSQYYELFIEYWNPDGQTPSVSFDGLGSSPEVKIDFDRTFDGKAIPPAFTHVVVDNVRIIDSLNVNYQIEDITAYEWRDGLSDWKEDVEFKMQYQPVEDLNVMMVLDASVSLGDDFIKIKDYARDFANRIYQNAPSTKIGIIDFSDVINTLPPTNDATALNSYISNIKPGPFTTLYEAMHEGIEALQATSSGGKALLTFTDGTDNNSDPEYNPNSLINKLGSNISDTKINSFTIGLGGNGGVDAPILEQLAINGGTAAFPENVEQLGKVFESFSKSIFNVYNFTYIRNQQSIPRSNKVRLKFVIKASPSM